MHLCMLCCINGKRLIPQMHPNIVQVMCVDMEDVAATKVCCSVVIPFHAGG